MGGPGCSTGGPTLNFCKHERITKPWSMEVSVMVLKCPECQAAVDISPETARRYSAEGRSIGCPACRGRIRVESPSWLRRVPWMWVLGAAGLAGAAGLLYYFSPIGGVKPVVLNPAGEETTEKLTETSHGDAVLRGLVEGGRVKPEDLMWLLDAGEYEGGVVGMSSRRMDWDAAQALAGRVGAEVLEVGPGAPGGQAKLLGWLAETFPGSSGIPQWGLSGKNPQVVEALRKVVVPAPVEGGRRPVLLHWKAPSAAPADKAAGGSAEVPGSGK